MKIKASELSWMIREAIASRVRDIMEFSGGADPDPVEKGEDEDDEDIGNKPRVMKPGEPPEPPPEGEGDPDDPDGAEPVDDTAEKDKADALDINGDAVQPTGKINRDVDGKSIQSISVEPESKILPGAKEVIIAFDEVSDPLRVLVTPTGRMAFFWKGQLHDMP